MPNPKLYIQTVLFQLIQFSISTFFFLHIVGYLTQILFIHLYYIWFCLVGFYDISNYVGYLISNPIYTYIWYIGFGLVGFYGLSTIAGYLKLNPLYHHHHHHHVVHPARISLTISRHFSLLFIASGRSSGLHPVSSHSCWM